MNYIPRTRALFRPTQVLRTFNIARFASTGHKVEKVQYQSSEQNKVDIATEVTDKEGKHTKSSKNWNPDLASNSEEVVHAERKEAKKNHSVEEMQQKSVRNVQQREKKLENVDRKEVEDK